MTDNNEIRAAVREGLSERISEELPGLNKVAHEMVVDSILESIEGDSDIQAASNLAGIDKEAGLFSPAFVSEAAKGAASHIGKLGVGALGALGIHNFLKAKQNENLINQYADFQGTLAKVSKRNEVLAGENKAKISELGDSIFKFAPTVANDAMVLETVMTGAVQYGGLDPQTVRSLQELEERYHKMHEIGPVKNYAIT